MGSWAGRRKRAEKKENTNQLTTTMVSIGGN